MTRAFDEFVYNKQDDVYNIYCSETYKTSELEKLREENARLKKEVKRLEWMIKEQD